MKSGTRRDAAIPGRRYWVYVLETDHGHYVGHTARLRSRIREHEAGETESTAGANPKLAWVSRPFYRRDDAASFEAALKSLRQKQSPRFKEITGLDPAPFRHPAYAGAGNGCLLPLVATAGILAAFAWGLLSLF